VIGLAVAAAVNYRKRGEFFWLIGISIVFMIAWRLIIEIISSRYASILIYPATIATAYACFKVPEYLKAKFDFSPQYCKVLSWLLIGGLTLAGVGKSLHFNSYADHIIKAGSLIAQDSGNYSNYAIFSNANETKRIAYYSGGKAWPVDFEKQNVQELSREIFLKFQKIFSEPYEVVYFLTFEKKSQAPGEIWDKHPAWIKNNLVFLSEFPHNRKKKRVTRVYRYNIKEAFAYKFAQTAANGTNTPAQYSCSFESILPENSKYYQQVKSFFAGKSALQQPELKDFPQGWDVIGTPGYFSGSNAELGVKYIADNKQVFYLKSDSAISVFNGRLIPAERWKIKITVSGRKGTVWGCGLHGYNQKYGWMSFYIFPPAEITSDGVFQYTVEVPEDFLNKDNRFLRLALMLTRGEVFVHSVELMEPDTATDLNKN